MPGPRCSTKLKRIQERLNGVSSFVRIKDDKPKDKESRKNKSHRKRKDKCTSSVESDGTNVFVKLSNNSIKVFNDNFKTLKRLGDKKLIKIPVVEIGLSCQGRAEQALDKMRLRNPSKKLKRGREGEDKDVSSDSEDSVVSSPSEHEDSDNDEVFTRNKKPRTYTFRRKSKSESPTHSDSGVCIKEKEKKSSSSSTKGGNCSDDSSESLLDIPPPTGGRSRGSTSETAIGPSKSPKGDEKTPAKLNASKRSLRSSGDGTPTASTQSPPTTFASVLKAFMSSSSSTISQVLSYSSSKKTPPKQGAGLGSGSPDRSSPVMEGEGSVSGVTRSYPLRGLERKPSEEGISLSKAVSVSSKSIDKEPPPPRKPGRPRKSLDSHISLSVDDEGGPSKRTRRTLSHELAPTASETTSMSVTEKKKGTTASTIQHLRKQLSDPAKHQRDAIAQRARQSKIMAKSRVLQSNKYGVNASWRKQLHNRAQHPSSLSEGIDDDDFEISPAFEAIGDEAGCSSDTTAETSLSTDRSGSHDQDIRCEICNFTFTRNASLLKHLGSRQHQRMSRRMAFHRRKLKREERLHSSNSSIMNHDINLSLPNGMDSDDVDHLFDFDEDIDEEPYPGWTSGHVDGAKFVCDVCGDIFLRRYDFSAHLWGHRSGSDLVCPDCDLKFADSDKYNEHIDSAHQKKAEFSCSNCRSKFIQIHYLNKHLESHKRDENGKFICSACDMRFQKYIRLSQHFDYKHLQLGRPKVELSCKDVFELNTSANNRKSLSEVFPTNESDGNDLSILEEDAAVPGPSRKTSGTLLPETDTVVALTSAAGVPKTSGVVERYSCTICNQEFKWRYLLKYHIMNRHSRKKVTVKGQKKAMSFLGKKPLGSGMETTKTKASGASSSSTGRTTPTSTPTLGKKGTLLNYFTPKPKATSTASTSTSSKPTSKAKLERAPKPPPTNEPEPPEVIPSPAVSNSLQRTAAFEPKPSQGFLKCDRCPKAFTDENTRKVHIWYHENTALLNCPDCDAKCERKSDFDLHYKCHTTCQPFYICYVCFKPFRWKKDMIRHVRKKHPHERTYRCIYCPQRFRLNEELTHHISTIHAQHRNFPCDYCGKRYAQKRYLVLHIRSMHASESGVEADPAPDQDDDEEEERESSPFDETDFN